MQAVAHKIRKGKLINNQRLCTSNVQVELYILIAIEDVGCCFLAYVLLVHGARCAYHISTSNEYRRV